MIKQLAKEARKHGICDPGLKRILENPDKEALIKYFIEGIDFCLEHNFPSNEFLTQYGSGLIEKHGLIVDGSVKGEGGGLTVLLGSSAGDIQYSGYAVADLFVKHNSIAKVEAKDNSFLRIDCFDKADVSITTEGESRVLVNVYGDAKVKYKNNDKGHVKVVYKGKESY